VGDDLNSTGAQPSRLPCPETVSADAGAPVQNGRVVQKTTEARSKFEPERQLARVTRLTPLVAQCKVTEAKGRVLN